MMCGRSQSSYENMAALEARHTWLKHAKMDFKLIQHWQKSQNCNGCYANGWHTISSYCGQYLLPYVKGKGKGLPVICHEGTEEYNYSSTQS